MSAPGSLPGLTTSYKTNVNRTKTKRWVEAKSYTYDGDEWGNSDDDDDDDDDTHDEPSVPVATPQAKPTGLRQRTPSANAPSTPQKLHNETLRDPADALPPPPPPPPPQVHQEPPRSPQLTKTGSPPKHVQPVLDSSTGSYPQSAHGSGSSAAREQSASQPKHMGAAMPPAQSSANSTIQHGAPRSRQASAPNPGTHSRSISAHSGTFHNQPSPPHKYQQPVMRSTHDDRAMYHQDSFQRQGPGPAHDAFNATSGEHRGVPASRSNQTGTPSPHKVDAGTRPPRKSSLGQQNRPSGVSEPWNAPGEVLPPPVRSGRSHSGASSAEKSLPIIRPADIYRRMEEERERARISQESSRPSMDRSTESGPDRPGSSSSRRSGGGQRPAPRLTAVVEQHTKHGFDAEIPPTPISNQQQDESPTLGRQPVSPPNTKHERSSLKPAELKLPDPVRVSGFGMDFGTSAWTDRPSSSSGPTAPKYALHAQSRSVNEPTSPRLHDLSKERSGSGSSSATGPVFTRFPRAARERAAENALGIDMNDHALRDQSLTSDDSHSDHLMATRTSDKHKVEGTTGDSYVYTDSNGIIPQHELDMSGKSFHPERSTTEHRPDGLARVSADIDGNKDHHPSASGSINQIQKVNPTPLADPIENAPPQRPEAERKGTFRPALPGGWESSASAVHTISNQRATVLESTLVASRNPKKGEDHQPPTEEPTSTLALEAAKDVTTGALSAAAQAGTSLAEALVSAAESLSVNDPPNRTRESHLAPNSPEDEPLSTNEKPRSIPAQQQTAGGFHVPEQDQSLAGKSDAQEDSSPQLPTDTVNLKPQTVSHTRHSSRFRSPSLEFEQLHNEVAREYGAPNLYKATTREEEFIDDSRPDVEEDTHEKSSESTRFATKDDDKSLPPTPAYDAVNQSSQGTTSVQPHGVQPTEKSQQPFIEEVLDETMAPNVSAKTTAKTTAPNILEHRFSWEQPLADLSETSQPQVPDEDAASRQDLSIPRDESAGADGARNAGNESVVRAAGARNDGASKPYLDTSVSQTPGTSVSAISPLENAGERYARGSADGEEASSQDQTRRQTSDSPISPLEQTIPEPIAEKINPRQSQERIPSPPPKPTTTAVNESPIPAPIVQIRPPAFKEILALKTPAERIRAFKEAQQIYRSTDTGLQDWLITTGQKYPQHNDIVVVQRLPLKSGADHLPHARAGGHRDPSGQANGSPAYYQQYLESNYTTNASTNIGGGGTANTGSNTASNTNTGSNELAFGYPGFGAPGTKISGQQVQAKSKELLHSAGVLGGKANVAAKGLFSKGKSKLRDASGSKKA